MSVIKSYEPVFPTRAVGVLGALALGVPRSVGAPSEGGVLGSGASGVLGSRVVVVEVFGSRRGVGATGPKREIGGREWSSESTVLSVTYDSVQAVAHEVQSRPGPGPSGVATGGLAKKHKDQKTCAPKTSGVSPSGIGVSGVAAIRSGRVSGVTTWGRRVFVRLLGVTGRGVRGTKKEIRFESALVDSFHPSTALSVTYDSPVLRGAGPFPLASCPFQNPSGLAEFQALLRPGIEASRPGALKTKKHAQTISVKKNRTVPVGLSGLASLLSFGTSMEGAKKNNTQKVESRWRGKNRWLKSVK